MALIGSLAVNIVARTDGLRKGLKKANRDVDRFGGSVEKNRAILKRWHTAIIGVAGATGFGMLIKRQLQMIDAVGKVSDRLGITTEALTSLHHAARLSGVDVRALEMGLQRMLRRVAEAADDTGEAKDALRDLGLNARALAVLAPEEQFSRIADALNRVEVRSKRLRFAFKLFDSEGVRLLQMTNKGSAGLSSMAEEARSLGVALDDLGVEKVEDLNDSITRLGAAFDGLQKQATIAVAGPGTKWAEGMTSTLQMLNKAFSRTEASGPGLLGTGGFQFITEFRKAWKEESERVVKAQIAELNRWADERIAKREQEEARRPINQLINGTRSLGDRIGRLTDETSKLWKQFEQFPSRVRTDSLIQQLQSFGRFFAGFERTQIQGRDPIGDIKKQFGAFGRFFGGLAFRPEQSFRTGTNAAIEAGTREAYIANQSGKRRQHLARIAEQQKKEINLAEAANNLLQSIRDKLKDTAQTVGIP